MTPSGGYALIQRCRVHKGRNIIERLDPSLYAGVKKVLRQAWDSPTLRRQNLDTKWLPKTSHSASRFRLPRPIFPGR